MSVDLLVAPPDGWRKWSQRKVQKWFSKNAEGGQLGTVVSMMLFAANLESHAGPVVKSLPVFHRLFAEEILDAAATESLVAEIEQAKQAMMNVAASDLLIISESGEDLGPEADLSMEQIQELLQAQADDLRQCLDDPTSFVRDNTRKCADQDELEKVLGDSVPENLSEVFSHEFSVLEETTAAAVRGGRGVLIG